MQPLFLGVEAFPPTPPGLFLLFFQETGIFQAVDQGCGGYLQACCHVMEQLFFFGREGSADAEKRFEAAVAHHGDEDTVRQEEIFRQALHFPLTGSRFLPCFPILHWVRTMEVQTGKDMTAVFLHLDKSEVPGRCAIQENRFLEGAVGAGDSGYPCRDH